MLKLDKPAGSKPVIIVDQDGCIFKSAIMQTSYWGLQGQAPQAQKTEGSGFMVSGYAVWGVGFVALTGEKKAEVEAALTEKYRTGLAKWDETES